MAVETSTLNTLGGYAILVAIGAIGYYVTRPPTRAVPKPVQEPLKEKGLKKKERAEKARLVAKEKPQTESTSAPVIQNTVNARISAEDEVDNREFARQLSSVKEGTRFTSKTPAEQRKQKSVKQSRAEVNNFGNDEHASAPSSTTGIDADDDQSPTLSPQITPADAGDVTDMLEAPAPGPSSLRLVDTDADKPKQKPKEKVSEPAETKKQRQNKKKAEAAKVAREEAEKERKVKMEAQRRAARKAEGRAAKDGSEYTNAAVNGSKSVWKDGAPGATAGKAAPAATQPLDTFDKPAETPAPAAAPSKPAETWMSSLPSEEEQMEQLKSEEEWSTVKPAKSKKAKKNAAPAAAEAKEETVTSAPSAPAPKTVQKPMEAPAATNGKPKMQSYGSFAALSTDEPEEEEWDV